jgi:hypothetical protein
MKRMASFRQTLASQMSAEKHGRKSAGPLNQRPPTPC